MLKKVIVLTVVATITTALAACASTGPSALSGTKSLKPIYNDKQHVVGYQAQ